MNRKQAERKSEKWLAENSAADVWIGFHHQNLTYLLLLIDKAAYKRGVKDGVDKATNPYKTDPKKWWGRHAK